MPEIPRRRIAALLSVAVAATGVTAFAAPSAHANPAGTGLVINEVYGGGGNAGTVLKHDFVELYNPTNAPISLAGMSLQYRAATTTSPAAPKDDNLFALPEDGVVASNGYYLVQLAAGTSSSGGTTMLADLTKVDAVGAIAVAAGAGQLALANTTTGFIPTFSGNSVDDTRVIDFIGWGTANRYEGSGAAPATTGTTSVSRATLGVDSDDNSVDFATATAPTPQGSGPAEALPLTVASISDKTFFQDKTVTAIKLSASGGKGPYTWSATGLPAGVAMTGDTISGTPTELGDFTVTVTATDASSPEAGVATVTFKVSVAKALTPVAIAEVQGDGPRSPYAPAEGSAQGETVTVEGIVTGMHADVSWAGTSSGFDGMYIQTAGTGGTTDATPGKSDGIFVYGSHSMPAGLKVGDSVRVTGGVAEFWNLTQIVPATGGVEILDTPLAKVTPTEVAYPATEAGREAYESMVVKFTDEFTVSNVYSTNGYGEIGIAAGDTALKQPTEYVKPSDLEGIKAIRTENAARALTIDDGTSINYLGNRTNKGEPTPYLTKADGTANPIRVGAEATFNKGMIFDYRRDLWRLQPTTPVFKNGEDFVTFEDTRAENLAPQNVGGNLKLATFNVLNYFKMTGEEYVAAGETLNPPADNRCSFYTDRANPSNRITNNSCGVQLADNSDNDGRGPRGAATEASRERQEAKLVRTINALGADIVSLEELENTIKLPGKTNRDEAIAYLVKLLNADDAGTWAYVRSPGEALTADAIAEQDVIRPGFIYKVASVETVGQSDILFGTDEFSNAREPLAQAFKAKGASDADAFAVIVNHYKSKGDNSAPGAPAAVGDNANDSETGVGAFNGDRVRQSTKLAEFAEEFADSREIKPVFLVGDFNAYSKERPIEVLNNAGFDLVKSDQADDHSYSYDGHSGSLDHVLANAEARALITGSDVWEINADESIAFQYSRHNYNVTDFWEPLLPFATSDHNPHLVGLNVPNSGSSADLKEVQVVATNDFHGRLLPDAGSAAGAGPLATAVDELRAENPNTVFAAAGDLIGASTFESFIQDDEPTIDALNAMGLEVSAAGNHEFDRGYADLVGRVAERAEWEYIAANVEVEEGMDKLAESWTTTLDGVKVGFVGAVTEDLPALVAPAGIEGVTVTDVVEATNAAATKLKADGAEVVVLLVHEGAATTSCMSDSFTNADSVFGNIVQNTSADVDAIVSGHTHLAYNCRFTVDEWEADEDRTVTKRPVVSAGQYGTNLNKLVFKFDRTSGDLAAISQDVIAAAGVGYESKPSVQAIVDAAVTHADAAGKATLGVMDGELRRATYAAAAGTIENRGGESALSNMVAEAQRWATEKAGIKSDIAFMNPGGLRADMAGTAEGDLFNLSYRQAADVQPFANTLVNVTLTGAQIKTLLEQQWQRNLVGGVPSRPFLKLGVSEGFTYTYTETPEEVRAPNAAAVSTFRGEVTGMWLNGAPIELDKTYTVTANSFLAGGGDNFTTFAKGTKRVDSGQVDLAAMVDYMAQYATAEKALKVDYSQRGVRVSFAAEAPSSYAVGETIAFDIASWSLAAGSDKRDSELKVMLGEDVLGTFPVDNAAASAPYDTIGTASAEVVLPAVANGDAILRLVGDNTGTSVVVPATINVPVAPRVKVKVPDVDAVVGAEVTLTVDVAGNYEAATGSVVVTVDGEDLTAVVDGGIATVVVSGLAVGTHEVSVKYVGDDYPVATASALVKIAKRSADISVDAVSVLFGKTTTVAAQVPAGATGSVLFKTEDGTILGASDVVEGKAVLELAAKSFAAGTTTVVVTYSGDDTYKSATSSVDITVEQAEPAMKFAGTTMTFGSALSLTAKVAADATGTVAFTNAAGKKLGVAEVKAGAATLKLAARSLSVGANVIVASYSGDRNYTASSSRATVKVNKANAKVAVSAGKKSLKAKGKGTTLTIRVAGAPNVAVTGKVRISVKGRKAATVTVKNGVAKFKVKAFSKKGIKKFTVRYEGNAQVSAAKGTFSIKVK